MIDWNIYAYAKATNTVTLSYDGVSIITATFQQFDPYTGLALTPMTMTGLLADTQAQLAASKTTMANVSALLADMTAAVSATAVQPPAQTAGPAPA
jgi:hypothetical protein